MAVLELHDIMMAKFSENGIGPKDYNCWNSVREVLKRATGKLMPMYSEYLESIELDSLITSIRDSNAFIETNATELYSIVIMNGMNPENPQCITHMGIMIEKYKFFQIRRNTDASIENVDRQRWIKRIQGNYRYVGHTTT